ncbi:single-stranded-DNA-specific exonuclease RecJ [Moorella naiadis]|uniref:single-stranded-DNA-specific exonuclease RecJ n=1 Tax=Moorella naiadis (nom. illeg.) TaxID=3093670 RepID=UPI003D9CB234
MTAPVWEIPPASLPERLALARELHIAPITAQVLLNRGLTTAVAARAFLQPDPANILPPEAIPGLAAARDRLVQAITAGERILIHGDYDVDGLAATAILLETLARLGATAEYYLPDRLAEGYGLKRNGLDRARARGCRLLVTVDCGITSLEEAAVARREGLELIITDHHQPGAELPVATAVVNPLLAPEITPLCGAGVAFKLAQSLANSFNLPSAVGVAAGWALDLVALGTIADAVPLQGENRLLVQLGLPVLAATRRPGVRALAEVAGLPAGSWSARQVAFGLVPRLNAAGRMGAADPALELLLTSSPQRALELAQQLEKENQTRRLLEEGVLTAATEMAVAARARGEKALVLAAPDWHPGVIGIVAARLVERFHCPVILIALAGEKGRGSGRSIPGVNLHELLSRCRAHLLAFGGHCQAAGLEVAAREIPAFRAAFNAALAGQGIEPQPPALQAEAEVLLSHLDWQLLAELEQLAPFGEGNPRPILVARHAQIRAARQVGKEGAHLKMTVAGEGREIGAIGFNLSLPPGLAPGRPVDLAFFLERNTYREQEELQLKLVDLEPTQPEVNVAAGAGELVAATGEGGTLPTWGRRLQELSAASGRRVRVVLATTTAVRQAYNGCRRFFPPAETWRPLGPWLGRAGVAGVLERATGVITCSPFWPATSPDGEVSLFSPLVQGNQPQGQLLQPAADPATWEFWPELLPFLTASLEQDRRILLYVTQSQLPGMVSRLAAALPGRLVAVDTYGDYRQFLLAREGALAGRLPLLVARREVPAWFYPADLVVFTYQPGSQEEVELALPPGEQLPRVAICRPAGERPTPDLRQELAAFYRQLQRRANRGRDLYILNNKGYHQLCYLAIFEELGLIRVTATGRGLLVQPLKVTARRDLMASRRYQQLEAERELAREFQRQLPRKEVRQGDESTGTGGTD